MKKEISIMQLSNAAWDHLKNNLASWMFLAAGGLFVTLISVTAIFYIPYYKSIASILLCLPGAIYTAMLHQNGLDAAYGRKLSMMRFSPSVLFASLFFIAISLHFPFSIYSELLIFMVPENFRLSMTINFVVHMIIAYLLVRCMFVGMIILEKKSNVVDAFKKSFSLTAHQFLFLLGIFFYFFAVLTCGVITIIGYFIVLPYTILMKSFLFKQLNEHAK